MSEWQTVRLGELCEVFDGPHATPPKQPSGNIFLGISSLGFDGRIDPAHFEYVDDQHYAKWTRRITPRPNDIVFSYETKLGVAAKIPQGFKCCLGRRMALLRTNDKVDPDFLLWYYLSPPFQAVIHERTYHGSTVDRIPLREMPDFPVDLPPLPEQRAIAGVLSSLDDKIGLLHRQNKTLEAMAETLFRQWFVEQASEDWERGDLGDYVTISYGKNLPTKKMTSEGYPVFGANGQIGFYSEFNYELPQVLVSCRGEASGTVNFSLPRSFITNNSLALVRKASSEFGFSYLKYWALSYDFRLHVSGSAQPQITIAGLHDANFLLPPIVLVKSFESIAQTCESKMAANTTQIQTLEKLRDTLLPKLMSGEVRVSVE